MSIEWRTPPPRPSGPAPVWVQRLEPFTERPGEWGLVPGTYQHSTLHDLRRGYYVIPPGYWSFDHRPVRPGRSRGRHHIWALYLGRDDPVQGT